MEGGKLTSKTTTSHLHYFDQEIVVGQADTCGIKSNPEQGLLELCLVKLVTKTKTKANNRKKFITSNSSKPQTYMCCFFMAGLNSF